MSFQTNNDNDDNDNEDLTQAFLALAKGEKTATLLENQLSQMEARIEQLLAQTEREQGQAQSIKTERSTLPTKTEREGPLSVKKEEQQGDDDVNARSDAKSEGEEPNVGQIQSSSSR